MLFHTLEFFCFFLIVYSLYLCLNTRWQNRMLLLASYIFYGSWDWRFLALIFISTLVNYFCGLKIYSSSNQKQQKTFLTLSLIVSLGLLGFFKYFNFFTSNLENLLLVLGWQISSLHLKIVLPIGISFYTFQTLSYTIDIYRNKLRPQKNFLDFALFVAFFPQLVAGPIERAANLLPQITSKRTITRDMIKGGLWLIFYGLFLKVFVADNMARIANQVFSQDPALLTGGESLMGVYAFAFQILGDFAGYSSMAIGIAKLMGINLMTNFLYPYFVTNPRDFWRSWHISLSSWLRDYLYVPLGGDRNGKYKTYRNLFVTMFLGGLWHGAGWTFLLWGVYHGMILIIYRLFTEIRKPRRPSGLSNPIGYVIGVIFMFHVTCLGWLIFRAQSLDQIGIMLSKIFLSFGPFSNLIFYGKEIVFYGWLLVLIMMIQKFKNDPRAIAKLRPLFKFPIYITMTIGIVFVAVISIITQGRFSGEEFIYFQF